MPRRGGTGLWRNESGATAALYALALPALVAVVGLGFDYAHLTSLDTELQNAADQAALAGATQLDRQSGAITRATSAAQGGLVENFTMMANDGKGSGIDVVTVSFYSTQAAAESCGNTGKINPAAANADTSAAFICVTVETRTANYALTPIAGALRGSTSAKAAAGVGSALCRTPPLMMCNPEEPASGDATADFNANAHIGKGFLVVQGGGGSWAPGNFGYLDTGIANGAPGVRAALGWLSPPGECVSQTGNSTVDTEPGNMANVTDALNTRFDIYDNQACPTGGPGCPASINSRKDVLRAANASGNNSCRLHNSGWTEPTNSAQRYEPLTNAPITTTPVSMGHPRDICHAISVKDCGGNNIFGDGFWDRDAYFRTHYLRTTNGSRGNAGTRWNSSDWQFNTGLTLSGGSRPNRPTRYEVYLWEIQHAGQVIDGVEILGKAPPNATGNTLVDHGKPVCSGSEGYGSGVTPSVTTADRRRISVAVVNCKAHGVRGNTTGVPVRRWMDVFLVQPSLDRKSGRTKKDEIYVEIIGETAAGSAGENAGTVIRRDVPYLLK